MLATPPMDMIMPTHGHAQRYGGMVSPRLSIPTSHGLHPYEVVPLRVCGLVYQGLGVQ